MIGTAGWSIAARDKALFDHEGSHLERYARRFDAVEINSSFYRPHKPATYARWAASVPRGFRFSVKLPKAITHEARLIEAGAAIERFAAETAGLGSNLGVVLVQLPPSLAFDVGVACAFFAACRQHISAPLVLEPRHASWFEPAADDVLIAERIARVAADPARVVAAALPGGWPGLAYFRLHGSPVIYRSSYADRLPEIARALRAAGDSAWCIFDNTASMAAISDAVGLSALLHDEAASA